MLTFFIARRLGVLGTTEWQDDIQDASFSVEFSVQESTTQRSVERTMHHQDSTISRAGSVLRPNQLTLQDSVAQLHHRCT